MKEPHLLRVERQPHDYTPLITALREAGLRAGWLELETPPTVSGSLETAAAAGALRAVAVGGGRSLAVKPLYGAPVLRDLLREHFRGCRLVLVCGETVCGETDAPWLFPGEQPGDGGWWVDLPAGRRSFSTAELIQALGRPHPWGRTDAVKNENEP
jgi:hypothetical protein